MKTATFTISQLVCRPIGYNKHCDLRIVLCLTGITISETLTSLPRSTLCLFVRFLGFEN